MDEFQEIIELLDDERSYWRRVLIVAWATTKSRKEYTIINVIIALIVSLSTTALTDSGNWPGMLLYVQFVITLLISFLILQITSTPASIDRELRKKVQKRILKLEQQVQELALDIASIEHRIPRQKASIRWEPNYEFGIRTKVEISGEERNDVPLFAIALFNSGEKRARDITIRWIFHCNDFVDTIRKSGLFDRFLFELSDTMMILKKTDIGSKIFYHWDYALKGKSHLPVLTPVVFKGTAHEEICAMPRKVTRAVEIYTLSRAYLANCLPVNATGQPMTAVGRVSRSSFPPLPTGFGPLDQHPPELHEEVYRDRELSERMNRVHDLPLIEIIISYEGGKPGRESIRVFWRPYFVVLWQNGLKLFELSHDIASPDYVDLTLELSEDTYLGEVKA